MRKYLAIAAVLGVLLSPIAAGATAVTWDFSSNVLKPLQALLGKQTSIGTSTAQSLTTLTVSATSTATTNILSAVDSTGATIFKILASGTASTTKFQANGLATCQAGNFLTWTGGVFGCAADQTATGAATFAFSDNFAAINAATSSPIWAQAGLNASTTSHIDYASSTALTVTGQVDFDGLTSALIVTGATGVLAEYAGIDCTNQFVRDVSAAGAGTCATVGAADVDLADLTATNSTLTFSGTYDGQTARTIGLNLANANTWTGGQIFGSATSTLFNITPGASLITPIAGDIGIDTTTGQLRYSDVTGTVRVIAPLYYASFAYATSTAWTGTTTIPLGPAGIAETWKTAQCFTDTGTVQVSFTDATNRMNWISASTTVGKTTLTTNNSFTLGEKRYAEVGTPASSPTRISCTVGKTYDVD